MVLLNTDQAVDFPPFVTDQILKLKKKKTCAIRKFSLFCVAAGMEVEIGKQAM